MLRWPHSSLVTCHLSLILHLASTNAGKLREFRQAGNSSRISVEPVPGAQNLPPCVEDGATFEENARKKAVYYSAYVEGLAGSATTLFSSILRSARLSRSCAPKKNFRC